MHGSGDDVLREHEKPAGLRAQVVALQTEMAEAAERQRREMDGGEHASAAEAATLLPVYERGSVSAVADVEKMAKVWEWLDLSDLHGFPAAHSSGSAGGLKSKAKIKSVQPFIAAA